MVYFNNNNILISPATKKKEKCPRNFNPPPPPNYASVLHLFNWEIDVHSHATDQSSQSRLLPNKWQSTPVTAC